MFFVDDKLTLTRRESSLVRERPSVSSSDNAIAVIEPSQSATIFNTKLPPPPIDEQIIITFFEAVLDIITDEWDIVESMSHVLASPSDESTAHLKTESEVSLKTKKGKKTPGALSSKSKKDKRAPSAISVISPVPEETINQRTSYWAKADERSVIVFKNGNRYEGNVSRKCMHGEGRFHWRDGTVYMGNFYFNEIKGRGRIEWPNGSWYEGEFLGNARHGKGLFVKPGQYQYYQGDWYRAAKHGKGIIHYGPSNYYDGEWYKNTRTGFGEREYNKTSGYRGGWKDNLRNGEGKMIWSNHDYYNGEWQRGYMLGKGIYIWDTFFHEPIIKPAKAVYNGEWDFGMRHGHGILELGYLNGAVYKGELSYNKKHGRGLLITGYGTVYKEKKLFDNDNLHVRRENISNETRAIRLDTSAIDLSLHIDIATNILSEECQIKLKVGNDYIDTNISDNCADFLKTDEERKNLGLAIQNHQKELTEVYHHYATLSNKSDQDMDQYLIRLFLWQIFFDCELFIRGYTVHELDELLFSEKRLLLRSVHDPFERIYYWQFLHIMVALSIHLSDIRSRKDLTSGRVLSRIFRNFILTVLYPSIDRFKDISKLLKCEQIVILSAYDLYQKMGPPTTIRHFLKAVHYPFNVKKPPQTILTENQAPGIKENITIVALGNEVYIDSPETIFAEEPSSPASQKEPTDLPLFNISNVTCKALLQLFAKLFPNIIQRNRVTNADTKITFFSFLEVLVMASEMSSHLRDEEMQWRRRYSYDSQLSPKCGLFIYSSAADNYMWEGALSLRHILVVHIVSGRFKKKMVEILERVRFWYGGLN